MLLKFALAVFLSAVSLSSAVCRGADDKPAATPPSDSLAPAVLPGAGLAQHDFLYAGEAKERRVFIVRKGAVVWSYDDPQGKGEISDASLLSNGNVLIAHQFAVKLLAPDKKVLWNFDAPAGSEIHTAQAIGKEHVLFIQNGDPAMLKVVNVVSGETKKEFPLPCGHPKSVHGQFRHARLTPDGTLLVAHHDWTKVAEYNSDGKEIWSTPAKGPWSASLLKNGNVLIVESDGLREITRAGEKVWSFARADVPEYKVLNLQLAWRLPNGNTLFNSWNNSWQKALDKANPPVQALEITPEKKVVWALRSWTPPADLGPASTIQILEQGDEPMENVHFGTIQ